VEAAARKAQAHDFICSLKDWRGNRLTPPCRRARVKLSAASAARRARARDPQDAPILVLDEATSSLDSEVEVAIQEELPT